MIEIGAGGGKTREETPTVQVGAPHRLGREGYHERSARFHAAATAR
jgi:hypothetical protein